MPGQLPKERVIHLEGLSAPRIGNRDRPDEVRELIGPPTCVVCSCEVPELDPAPAPTTA